MRIPTRLGVAAMVFVISYVWIYWVPYFLFPAGSELEWLTHLISLGAAAAVAWFAWSRSLRASDALVARVLRYALVAYLVGFVVAVLSGPVMFPAKPNQGLLFGFFFSGPAGALLGGAMGLFASRKRAKLERPT